MAKSENFKMEGTVIEVLPNTMFRVKVDNEADVDMIMLATLSGKMRQNHIRVLMGDRVEIECSPYDLSRGRITRRR